MKTPKSLGSVQQPQQSLTAILYCRKGPSDKVYRIMLRRNGGGWLTTSENGRRGSAMIAQFPMGRDPADYQTARAAFDKVYKAKAKEYTEDARGNRLTGPPPIVVESDGDEAGHADEAGEAEADEPAAPQMIVFPVKEHSGWHASLPKAWVDDLDGLIADSDWVVQEKFDGRYLGILIEGGQRRGVNKLGHWIPLPVVLDEAVIEVAAAAPWCYLVTENLGNVAVAHDLLMLDGADMTRQSYRTRLDALTRLIDRTAQSVVQLPATAWSREDKARMVHRLRDSNAEGAIFKHQYAAWEAGETNQMLKVKFVASNTFVVTRRNRQRSVRIGAVSDDGNMIDLGSVTIPADQEVPEIGQIIEVRYLYAYPKGKLAQPVSLGVRDDVEPDECRLSKIKLKRIDA